MKVLLIVICTFITSFNVYANESIHYFDLKYRPANEVIPLLQPLLQEGEAISGNGYQLFIKTKSQRKQEIENLISAIDKTIKMFRISVTNDEYISTSNNEIDVSINAQDKDVGIVVGRKPSKESNVSINIDTRKTEDKSDQTQFIQVQEGKPAFISRENLHIIPIYSYIQRPNGNFLIEHNQLAPTQQDGFYVVARSADGRTANINIQSATSNRQTYHGYGQDQTYINTTLRVPLGEWIEIGGNTDTVNSESSGTIYKTKKNSQRHKKIFLKIDLSSN